MGGEWRKREGNKSRMLHVLRWEREKKMFPYSVAAEGLSVPLSLDEIKWKERRHIKTQSCKKWE